LIEDCILALLKDFLWANLNYTLCRNKDRKMTVNLAKEEKKK